MYIRVCAAVLLTFLLTGCFTSAALRETQGYKSRDFYPRSIAWNQAEESFAIVGVRSKGANIVPAHVVVPEAFLLRLTSPEGEIRLSDLKKLSPDEVRQLRVVDGPVPKGFVEVVHEPEGGVVLNQGRTVFRPTPLLILPATLVIDVVTLPIAIPLLNSLENVH